MSKHRTKCRLIVIAVSWVVIQLFTLSVGAVLVELPNKSTLTSDVLTIRAVADKASIDKVNTENAQNALVSIAANSPISTSLYTYLFSKSITKQELEAFKWSFIISQFALPLQDNMFTVFDNNDILKELSADDGSLVSTVETFSAYGELLSSELGPSALSETTFNELKEVIQSNINYLTVYKSAESGSAATFKDLIQSDGVPGGQVYYVKDTVLKPNNNKTGIKYNTYLHNVPALGEAVSSGDKSLESIILETEATPILAVNNITYLYLQTALGIYCELNNCTLTELYNRCATETLYCDAYGNICIFLDNDYRILIPNFGNSIFINSILSSGKDEISAEERMFMYNRWVTSAYSTSMRGTSSLYDINQKTILMGESGVGVSMSSADIGVNGTQEYLAKYLVDSSTSGNTRGNIVFFEPNDIYVYGLEYGWGIFKNIIDADGSEISLNSFSLNNSKVSRLLNLSASGVYGGLTTPLVQNIRSSNKSFDSITRNNLRKVGTFGFNAMSWDNNLIGIYSAPTIIVQNKVNLNRTAFGFYTVVDAAIKSLLGSSYQYDLSNFISSNSTSASAFAPYSFINGCYAVGLGWDPDKILGATTYVAANEDSSNYYMFLKENLVDFGQMNDVYVGDERGMFVPQYKQFYTGSATDLAAALYQLLAKMEVKLDTPQNSSSVGPVQSDLSGSVGTEITRVGNMQLKNKQYVIEFKINDNTYTFTTGVPPLSLVNPDMYKEFLDSSQRNGLITDAVDYLAKEFKRSPAQNSTSLAQVDLVPSPDNTSQYGDPDYKMWQSSENSSIAELAVTYYAMEVSDERSLGYKIQDYYTKAITSMKNNSQWWANTGDQLKSISSLEDFYDQLSDVLVGVGLMATNQTSLNNLKQMVTSEVDAGFFTGDLTTGTQYFFLSNYYLLLRDGRIQNDNNITTTDSTEYGIVQYFWDRYYLGRMSLFEQTFKSVWEYAKSEDNTYSQTLANLYINNKSVSASEFYSKVAKDEVVIYPIEDGTYKDTVIRIYYTPYEDFAENFVSGNDDVDWVSKDEDPRYLRVNYQRLLITLLKNSDSISNPLYRTVIGTDAPKEGVSIEEVTNSIGYIISHPIEYINYIFTGWANAGHQIFGTGDFSYVFTYDWVLNNPIMQWLSKYYLSISAAVLAILLLVRTIIYIFNKQQKFKQVMRDWAVSGICTLAPIALILVLIWAFNASSALIIKESVSTVLLCNIATKAQERINADAGVEYELSKYTAQFNSLEGSTKSIGFYFIDDFGAVDEKAKYSDELTTLNDLLDSVKVGTTAKWYGSNGKATPFISQYEDNLYYYFYDTFKNQYIQYFNANKSESNLHNEISMVLESYTTSGYTSTNSNSSSSEFKKYLENITPVEQAVSSLTGGVKLMMYDYNYIFGESAALEEFERYNTLAYQDIFGVKQLFTPTERHLYQASGWYKAILNSNLLKQAWEDECERFIAEEKKPANIEKYLNGVQYTKRYDAEAAPDIFEEKLYKFQDSVYKTIISTMDAVPQGVTDEALIEFSALIATLKFFEMFDLEPTMPELASINMEAFCRTIYTTDPAAVTNTSNLLSLMLAEGFSAFDILTVVAFEAVYAISALLKCLYILLLVGLLTLIIFMRCARGDRSGMGTLAVGTVSQVVGLISLHILTLLAIYLPLTALSKLKTSWMCVLMSLLAIVIVVAICMAGYKLLKLLFSDWQTMGGSMVMAKFINMKGKIQSKIQKSSVDTTELSTSDMDADGEDVSEAVDDNVTRTLEAIREIEETTETAAPDTQQVSQANTKIIPQPDVQSFELSISQDPHILVSAVSNIAETEVLAVQPESLPAASFTEQSVLQQTSISMNDKLSVNNFEDSAAVSNEIKVEAIQSEDISVVQQSNSTNDSGEVKSLLSSSTEVDILSNIESYGNADIKKHLSIIDTDTADLRIENVINNTNLGITDTNSIDADLVGDDISILEDSNTSALEYSDISISEDLNMGNVVNSTGLGNVDTNMVDIDSSTTISGESLIKESVDIEISESAIHSIVSKDKVPQTEQENKVILDNPGVIHVADTVETVLPGQLNIDSMAETEPVEIAETIKTIVGGDTDFKVSGTQTQRDAGAAINMTVPTSDEIINIEDLEVSLDDNDDNDFVI